MPDWSVTINLAWVALPLCLGVYALMWALFDGWLVLMVLGAGQLGGGIGWAIKHDFNPTAAGQIAFGVLALLVVLIVRLAEHSQRRETAT